MYIINNLNLASIPMWVVRNIIKRRTIHNIGKIINKSWYFRHQYAMGENNSPFIIADMLANSSTIGDSKSSNLNLPLRVVAKQIAVIKLAAKLRISIM